MTTSTRSRETRAGLLARADVDALVSLADRCLADTDEPEVTHPPEVGMVMLTVREPVESVRFHLAEVLVTRCEVRHRGALGWAMRMGTDTAGAVAAAVLDAESEADGPLAAEVAELCASSEASLAAADAAEWQAIQPTIVDFEEMH